ncbi:c-type cytochrome [Marinoscillum sp.]|uniref:c-type cytochrome n=1 Tax=Marinoscillum sp. TaxID=2024838 RepID=UPI003BAB43F4
MRLVVCVISLLILVSCGSKNNSTSEDESEMDHRTGIRLKQYMVQGKKLYTTYCANCHQTDGSGLAKLYPPLAKSDYLMTDLERAACIVKYGMNGQIKVNDIEFNQPMPANDLTPIEIAEIITYVSNSWGNEAGISSTRDVSQWLKKCKN